MVGSRRRKVALGLAGAGGVLALGIAVPSLAFAQDPTPTPSASSSADAGKPDRAEERARRQDELASALATELGIDKEKVAAALAKIQAEREANRPAHDGQNPPRDRGADLESRMATAVTEGKLTQAEADAILKAAEAGVLGPAGGPHGQRSTTK
jgi:hypothetical protein